MRLWSIHPKYLDRLGLNACWREGLLAQAVLFGNTVGYKEHSQLVRFKSSLLNRDLQVSGFYIGTYLYGIYKEAQSRGYNFNLSKIVNFYNEDVTLMTVTKGQLEYEYKWLLSKLKTRDPVRYARLNYELELKSQDNLLIIPHPIFEVVEGEVASWEKKKILV